MSLNKKFRTFMFSNILLGVIAFNNWANNSIYKDDISDVYYSCNYMDWSTRVTYKLNGKNESIDNPTFSEMSNLYKTTDDGKDGILSARGELYVSIAQTDPTGLIEYLGKLQYKDRLSVLLKMDKSNDNTVAQILGLNNSDKFIKLLRTFTPKDIMTILEQQTNDRWTVAHVLARYGGGNELVKLLRTFTTENIMTILEPKNKNGWTVAHMLARHGGANELINLLHTFSPEDIMTILAPEKQTNEGWTVAHMLACNGSGNELVKLLGKLKDDNIMTILDKENKNNEGWTVADVLGRNGGDNELINLLGKLKEDNIMTLLRWPDNALKRTLILRIYMTNIKLVRMLNRKKFTAEQKQEIIRLANKDVFVKNIFGRVWLEIRYWSDGIYSYTLKSVFNFFANMFKKSED